MKRNQEKTTNSQGRTDLYLAAFRGDLETAKSLLKSEIDPNDPNTNPNHPDKVGNTPFIAAVAKGHLEMAKLLLSHGAEVNSYNLFSKNTPLHTASHFGHSKIVSFLMQNGANPSAENSLGQTAFDIAESTQDLQIQSKLNESNLSQILNFAKTMLGLTEEQKLSLDGFAQGEYIEQTETDFIPMGGLSNLGDI